MRNTVRFYLVVKVISAIQHLKFKMLLRIMHIHGLLAFAFGEIQDNPVEIPGVQFVDCN